MIEVVDVNDSRAVHNKNNVLALYDLMINKKKSEEATAKFVSPAYIQHNPLIADGSVALGKFFGQVTRERARARVVVHRIIAAGDYVWAHVNFLNLFNDDPDDTGIAGVDIYKMDADGNAIEHWDTLQLVGDPKNSAPLIAPNIPRANPNGMFLAGGLAMNPELESLMERNLLEVFGQRDPERRAAAIAQLYTADCTFFEAEEQ